MPAPTAITQALTYFLPSFPASNKPFPPALVTQCESLLALSRQRASNLKQEEEIARAHACSEIACKRLRLQLRLPAIKNGAGAPCKPRTYTKLITFLEGVLADAPVGSLTPKGRKRDASGSIKENDSIQKSVTTDTEQDRTPSKRRTVNKSLGSTFAGKIKKPSAQHAAGTDQVPSFVMPSIRKLCKKFSTPSIAPHVYTGTCIILPLTELYPPSDPTNDDLTTELTVQISTLVIALYLMVLTRMRKGNMTESLYTSVSTQSLQVLDIPLNASEDIETWVEKCNQEEWCNGTEWFTSVPEDTLTVNPNRSSLSLSPSPTSSPAADHENRSRDPDSDMEIDSLIPIDRPLNQPKTRTKTNSKINTDTNTNINIDFISNNEKDLEPDPEGILLPGLGTMLHNGLDYTSEERKLDYRQWKTKALRRMNALEKNIQLIGDGTDIVNGAMGRGVIGLEVVMDKGNGRGKGMGRSRGRGRGRGRGKASGR